MLFDTRNWNFVTIVRNFLFRFPDHVFFQKKWRFDFRKKKKKTSKMKTAELCTGSCKDSYDTRNYREYFSIEGQSFERRNIWGAIYVYNLKTKSSVSVHWNSTRRSAHFFLCVHSRTLYILYERLQLVP